MHCQPQPRLAAPGRAKAGRRRYKTFMIDEILSKETCDYFEKLSLYSVCPSLLVRPKPLHSCAGKAALRGGGARGGTGTVGSPTRSSRGARRRLEGDPHPIQLPPRPVPCPSGPPPHPAPQEALLLLLCSSRGGGCRRWATRAPPLPVRGSAAMPRGWAQREGSGRSPPGAP